MPETEGPVDVSGGHYAKTAHFYVSIIAAGSSWYGCLVRKELHTARNLT